MKTLRNQSGSDGIVTEHLERKGLAQTGDENWDDEMSCLLEKLQNKAAGLNKKIQELENHLEVERSARKELELLIAKKAFNCKGFHTGFDNYVFSMVRDYLGRETAARLDIDYQNTENLEEI